MSTSASVSLESIRNCFEGVIPGTMATASMDGVPNVALLSQISYVDASHVALSYQFFNKTRQNLLANPRAVLAVIDPRTAAHYRLHLEFLRTERAGPLFESMKAKLAGLASHIGMSGVFQLLGADVFKVHRVEQVPGYTLKVEPTHRNLLLSLRRSGERIRAKRDLEPLLNEALACLEEEFGIEHSMALMHDAANERLYTLASHGYATSGVGAEIAMGQGVIGVAARERTPIRIGHMAAEYSYSQAIRNSTVDAGFAMALDTEIPLPGLAESRSQLAVPIMASERLVGVLYVESREDLRFAFDDEDALAAFAAQLGTAIDRLHSQAEGQEAGGHADDAQSPAPANAPNGAMAELVVRHFPENDSIFFGDDYLIKGVTGSIFAALLRDYLDHGRCEFSNRELRLDARIRLPDISDNLEARLLLLSRRLTERAAGIRLEKCGRGRIRLCVERAVKLAAGA